MKRIVFTLAIMLIAVFVSFSQQDVPNRLVINAYMGVSG
jgi:hypothetical protein